MIVDGGADDELLLGAWEGPSGDLGLFLGLARAEAAAFRPADGLAQELFSELVPLLYLVQFHLRV